MREQKDRGRGDHEQLDVCEHFKKYNLEFNFRRQRFDIGDEDTRYGLLCAVFSIGARPLAFPSDSGIVSAGMNHKRAMCIGADYYCAILGTPHAFAQHLQLCGQK